MSTMTLSSMTPSTFAPFDHTGTDFDTDRGPAPVRLRVVRPDEVVQPSRVRLTRRGRLTVFLASLGAVLSLGIALGAGSVATEQPGTPTPTRTVVVAPGDTLWGIAGELAADGEVRTMVERIERLNALDTALVQSGQRLRVPLTE
jgi:nucleoid-associated protein YgaU